MHEERYIWLSYYQVWQCKFAGFFDIFCMTFCGKVILLQSVTDCYYTVWQLLQSETWHWAFCICWVWFSISCFCSFSSFFRSSDSLSNFSAKKIMVSLILLRVFFSDLALRFLAPWPDLLPSSRFSLQSLFSFLSQPHRIVESSQVKHHLFLCALGWYHSHFLPLSTFFCTFSQVRCIYPWLIWS